MIQIENHSFKKISLIFLLSFVFGCLFFGWLEWQQTPISVWPTGVDVYPLRVGTIAFWRGESPYSAKVDLQSQMYLYGRPAEQEEDPMGFYYPAHAAIILIPLALLPAHETAMLWTITMWAIIAFLTFLIIGSFPEQTSPKLWVFTALSIFLFRPALISIINGQYTIFTLTTWGITYLLIRREHDILAGFVLALTTIKLSLAIFPLLVFLLWTLKNRRFKVTYSFVFTGSVFFLITIIQLGWWIPEFLNKIAEYDRFSRLWVTSNIATGPGIIWLTLTIILIYLGIQDFRRNTEIFPWLLFWGAISLNLLMTPHTVEYDLLVLILPFLIFAPRLFQTKPGLLGWIIVIWLPWFAYFIFAPIFKLTNIWTYYPSIVIAILLILIFIYRQFETTGEQYNHQSFGLFDSSKSM